MKVICISDNVANDLMDDLSIGVTYTVIDKRRHFGIIYYQLEELPINTTGCNQWYKESLFSPVSNIDERTFSRNYNKRLL